MLDLTRAYVYLFASDLPNPDRHFQGYCFAGSDYIFGEAGAERYRDARGTEIVPGEDGCYVTVVRDGADFVFGADHSGYKKIFYYSDAGFWVVSNALPLIVERLRGAGRPVRPNPGQLARFTRAKNITNQQTSFHTIVEGVRLVPSGCGLRIGPSGAQILPPAERPVAPDYPGNLAAFVELWLGRLETLLAADGITIAADLSGGLDSRAVFALCQGARTRLGEGQRATLSFVSSEAERKSVDLVVAADVCARYGTVLNQETALPPRIDARDSFRIWRSLDCGVYDPIRYPRRAIHPAHVSLTGLGGENNRSFYAKNLETDDLEVFLRKSARQVGPESAVEPFRQQMRAAVDEIVARDGGRTDPLILFYRTFRNTFHGGRKPQTAVTFNPLASQLMADCGATLPHDRLLAGQVFYDLMDSLAPELLDIPFDEPDKTPSPAIRAALTRIAPASRPAPGTVFADLAADAPETGARSGGGFFDHLQAEFDAACTEPFVTAFFGADYVKAAAEVLRATRARDGFGRPIEGKPIAGVIAAAMVGASSLTPA